MKKNLNMSSCEKSQTFWAQLYFSVKLYMSNLRDCTLENKKVWKLSVWKLDASAVYMKWVTILLVFYKIICSL